MNKYRKTNANNQILNQLVLENCLRFGRDPKLNNKKANHYIFGTRKKLDVFKLYELRYLLLKVYPLIHNLFLQVRLNVKKKKKFFFPRNFDFKNFVPHLPEPVKEWESFQMAKKKFNRSLTKVAKPLLPQILFATTNETYSDIVSSAARMCSMPFHVNRWLSGAITSGSFYKNDKEKWFFLKDDLNEQMQKWFQKKIFKHKKNIERQEHQMRKYQSSRKPSLVIIPDVSNNEKIIKETNVLGIPVLGLVNSHCPNVIAYPIFANDQSVYSIYFFCHFLSSLITKEIVKTKHKFKNASKKTISMQFPQALKNMSQFSTRFEKFGFGEINSSSDKEWVFKGKYFLEHYVKPRFRLRKKVRRWWNIRPSTKKKKYFLFKKMRSKKRLNRIKNIALNKTIGKLKKSQLGFEKKPRSLRFFLKNVPFKSVFLKPALKIRIPHHFHIPSYLHRTTRQTIFFENQKRLKKKEILGKINLLLHLRKFSFAQIQREIRLPTNLPKFRFWNVASNFYHRKPIKFAQHTAQGFRFKRFAFKRLIRKVFRQNQPRHRAKRKGWRIFRLKNKRKKRNRQREYQGFQQTEDFNRYLIKIGMRVDLNPTFQKNIKNKKPASQSVLYRKRWPSKKIKKK